MVKSVVTSSGRHQCRSQKAGIGKAPHAKWQVCLQGASPEPQVGEKDHLPGEERSEHRDRKHQQKRSIVVEHVEHGCENDADAGGEKRSDGCSVAGQHAEPARCEAGPRERKEHPGTDVELAVHRGKGSHQYHEVDNAGGSCDMRPGHHRDKG